MSQLLEITPRADLLAQIAKALNDLTMKATVLTCNENHKMRAAQPHYHLVRESSTASVKAQNQSGPADPPA